ncbi:MAG: extracellular solute-binding protein [Patescibacteria group bacterium]|nr:extracellular solute-binding protein [Patescibacteria group bacterium]
MKKFCQNKKIFILAVLSLVIITSGFQCGGPPAGLTPGKPTPITLNYWSVFNDSSNLQDLLATYQQQHPHITINYKNFTAEEYENELLNALAEDRGPDIFSIQTTWMGSYAAKILPLPASLTIPTEVQSGTIQKQTYTQMKTEKTLSLLDIRNLYPDVVYDNQVISDQIYGLPLSIDTLALYYNRDLLNNAGISSPPKTWDELRNDVIKLTKQDTKGNIIQAGAAIGTADNVTRSTDILSLLMMQDGAPMINEAGLATFSQVPAGFNRSGSPAIEALNFYTSFASPANQAYTWNSKMSESLQSFENGKTAFFFGYAYQIPTLKTQAPKLNFQIAPIPQIGNPLNFANYWVSTVSKKSQHPNEAWDFILYIAANENNTKQYLSRAHLPTALRSLISSQIDDQELSPFVNQILTAKSWYKGKNEQAAEQIFKDMINQNLAGTLPTEQIINLGVGKINQTY